MISSISKYLGKQLLTPLSNRPTTLQLSIGFFAPVTTILSIYLLASDVPFYDQWLFIPVIDKFYRGIFDANTLWEQHNEHRIPFPKLIMLGLALITHWNVYAEMCLIVFIALLVNILLCRAAFLSFQSTSSNLTDKHPHTLYCLISFFVFSMVQAENWLWGWQITIFLSILSVILGFYLLAFQPFRRSISITLSFICGVVATFSFANGLLYWIAGLSFVCVKVYQKKWNTGYAVSWLVIAIICYAAYFYGFKQVSRHPSIIYSLLHPFRSFAYFGVFLGAPVCQMWRLIIISFLLGIAGLILMFNYLIILWKNNKLVDENLFFWHGLLLYVLLTATLTTIGRSGFGVDQALSGRYVTISNLFWLWLAVIGYRITNFELHRFKNLISIGVFGVLILTCISGFRNILLYKRHKEVLTQHKEWLRTGHLDPYALKQVFPEDTTKVISGNAVLKQYHLAFYSE